MRSKLQQLGRFTLWTLYGLVLTVLFIYILFPAEQLRAYINAHAGNWIGCQYLRTDHLRFEFPATLKLENVDLMCDNQIQLYTPQLTVRPGWNLVRYWPPDPALQFRLHLQSPRLTLDVPLLGLEILEFRDSTLQLTCRAGQGALAYADFPGNQISAVFEGSLHLQNPAEASVADLRGRVRLHPAYRADLKQKLPPGLPPPPAVGRDDYHLRIRGPLRQPQLQLE